MLRVATILLLLLAVSAAPLPAQQYNFRNWSLEHGLPQSQVNDLLLDQKGQLWVATLGGASRFDGQTFHTYTKRQGLASNNTSCLFQDRQNAIWIGTSDAGLTRYNHHTLTVYAAKQGLPAQNISSISEDPEGQLWVATDSGVYVRQQDQFELAAQLPRQGYHSILCAPNGSVWAGSHRTGLYKTDRSGTINYTAHNSALPDNTITRLYQDAAGTLWIGTANGLAKYKEGKFEPVQLPPSVTTAFVTNMVQDKNKTLWVGLSKGGLLKYDGKAFTHLTKENGLRTNSVTSLEADSEGGVWIGTAGHGIQQHRNPWFVHYFELGQLEEPKVTALARDAQGRLWFGTDDSRVAYLKDATPAWLPTQNWPASTTINSICPGKENEVWLCTNAGVWQVKNGRQQHYDKNSGLPSDEVYHCLTGPDGVAWFATARGLARYEDGKFSPPASSSGTDSKAYYVHRDRRGTVWVGTDRGIYTLRNGKLRAEPALNQIPFTQVVTIAEDARGTLYFGGFNEGLLVWHPDWKEPRLLNTENGLPNESITGLYVDTKQNLWVGTSQNVLRMPLKPFHEEGKQSFQTYNARRGFRGIEVSQNAIAEASDSTLWFGTAKGLTRYLPRLDHPNREYTRLSFTDFQLSMKPTDWQKMGYKTDTASGLPVNPKLAYNQNHITLYFQGICLSGPEQIRFKYRLLGLDDAWSPVTKQTFVNYPNLKSGNYAFQLLASNNDNLWTPQPLTYSFSIAPPFWHREWFVALLMLAFFGSFIAFVRLRERNLVKLNLLLEQRVQHRTQLLEKKNREKETLLTEIHHRVKNNLQIVISLLNLQARHLQDPVALDVMRAIRSRVRSMAILHERLYHQEDLAHIFLDDYFRGICDSLYATFGATEYKVKLEFLVPPIKVDIDTAITLGLIVNEVISNSFKYAFSNTTTGVLHLELQEHEQNQYELLISDNGPGMPAQAAPNKSQSFGLKLVSTLTKKLNGSIRFENSNGTKTILFFVLPS